MKKVIQEGVLVGLAGVLLAFAANALSPRGLKLAHDYFPGATSPAPLPKPPHAGPGATNAPSHLEMLAARFREKGLQLAQSNQVIQLFRDPRYLQGQIIFVDARDDEHYHAGHIPGACQFDRYHPENYLVAVAPLLQAAEQIVVYCQGGDCEDSEFAALMLRDTLGLPKEKLLVYAGGITEWTANGLPLELRARNSGEFRQPNP